MSGEPETSPGGRRLSRNEEAGMGFKLDPREVAGPLRNDRRRLRPRHFRARDTMFFKHG